MKQGHCFFSGLVLAFGLSGCNLFQTKPDVQIVKVPVSTPCKIAVPTKPVFPLDSAKKEYDLHTKTSKALAEIEIRRAYEKELEATIKGCQE